VAEEKLSNTRLLIPGSTAGPLPGVPCYSKTDSVKTEGVKTKTMDVQRNIEASSYNHCCGGKAISITYSDCVFVVVGIQHAMRVYRTVICGLPRSTIFFHVMSYMARFSKEKLLNIQCFLIYSTNFF
jgi:hypothetical protein